MMWKVGMLVRADEDIIEFHFAKDDEPHYHARKGDQGIIEYIAEYGIPMVRFLKTGTASDVGHDQIFKYPTEHNLGLRGKCWRDAR